MALGTVATCLAPTMGMALGRNERSLFDPVRIGGLKIKNRMFKAATSMELGDEHGRPTPKHLKVYEDAAKGGGRLDCHRRYFRILR